MVEHVPAAALLLAVDAVDAEDVEVVDELDVAAVDAELEALPPDDPHPTSVTRPAPAISFKARRRSSRVDRS
jgi:hypothetical protein